MKNNNKTATYTEALVVLTTIFGFIYSAASLHFDADTTSTDISKNEGRRPAYEGRSPTSGGRRPASLPIALAPTEATGLEIDLGCLDGEGPAPWITVKTPQVRFKGKLCRHTHKNNKRQRELPLSEYEAFNAETSYTALFYKEDKPRHASTEFIPLEQGLNHLLVQPSKESKHLTTPDKHKNTHTIVVLRTR